MPGFTFGAITDELSDDPGVALDVMAELGLTAVELRVVAGRNIVEMTPGDAVVLRREVERRGLHVVSVASPLFKCVLPDAPSIDSRIQQDVFSADYTHADQPALALRTFAIARLTGASIVRVFSYWRTIDPPACADRIAGALYDLAEQAAPMGLTIGLENEHACNIATGDETARLLASVDHPNLKVVWDPANAMVAGEAPYSRGYRRLPPGSLAHVHAKDGRVERGRPVWTCLGDGGVDWRGQLEALTADRYHGAITLETHWRGPDNDRLAATTACARRLQAFAG
jgi:sugar phosphate isomerase/epimerase